MDEPQSFKLLQGVTTEIVGNCGFSIAPLDDASAAYVSAAWGDLAPGVEIVAGSFGAFLDRLEAVGPTNNVAPLMGHGTLRVTANGSRRELGDGTLERMYALAEEAFEGGRRWSIDGVDLRAGDLRGHRRDRRARADRRPVATSVRHPHAGRGRAPGRGARREAFGQKNRGKSALLLDKLHAARRDGIDIRGDQYPYTASSTFLVTLLPTEASVGGTRCPTRTRGDHRAP